jgi:putative glutamine amidotransferase
MLKRVLVPLAKKGDDTGVYANYGIRSSYLRKLNKYNLAPVLVAPGTPLDVAKMFYSECQGVLLLGGTDIEPKLYGELREPLTQESDEARDELELLIARMALKDKKPLLGICRGCQLLNVAAGGSLVQHIEERGIRHQLQRDDPNYSGIVRQSRHVVSVRPGTRSAGLIATPEVSTNSAHHQCAKRVGAELLVAGTAADGVIEILEHSDPGYFCFGVQCHPELDEDGPFEVFFQKFAEAVS